MGRSRDRRRSPNECLWRDRARDDEAAALLRALDGLIDGDRYFMSQRIKTLKAIRAKIRPEPVREPLPPLNCPRTRGGTLREISLAH